MVIKRKRTKNNQVEQICKNCKLFDPKEKTCQVVVVMDGEHYELPTEPENECFWVKNGLVDDIKQLKAWSDGENGYIEVSM